MTDCVVNNAISRIKEDHPQTEKEQNTENCRLMR